MEFQQTDISPQPVTVQDAQVIGHASTTPAQPFNKTPPRSTDILGQEESLLRPIGEDTGTTPAISNEQLLSILAPAPEVNRSYLWREASRGLTRIVIDPAVLDGMPAIRDTRISVAQLMDVLADMGTIRAVLSEFPDTLELADVQEALLFTAHLAR